jgi:WD40 repeat protein
MIWDAVHGDLQSTLACNSPVFAVAMQKEVAVTGTMAGATHIWDLHYGKTTPGSVWPTFAFAEHAPTFSLDGSPFMFSLKGHSGPVLAVAKRASTVVTGSADATARVWDAHRGQLCHILKGHKGRLEAVALHPDLHLVVTGSTDATARLWSTSTGQCLQILPTGKGAFATSNVLQIYFARLIWGADAVVAVALKGHKIVTASAHGKIQVWNRLSGKKERAIVQDDGLSSIRCRQILRGGIDMHEDGTVAVCWKEGFATVWNSETTTPQFVLTSGFVAGDAGTSNGDCRHALAFM